MDRDKKQQQNTKQLSKIVNGSASDNCNKSSTKQHLFVIYLWFPLFSKRSRVKWKEEVGNF